MVIFCRPPPLQLLPPPASLLIAARAGATARQSFPQQKQSIVRQLRSRLAQPTVPPVRFCPPPPIGRGEIRVRHPHRPVLLSRTAQAIRAVRGRVCGSRRVLDRDPQASEALRGLKTRACRHRSLWRSWTAPRRTLVVSEKRPITPPVRAVVGASGRCSVRKSEMKNFT